VEQFLLYVPVTVAIDARIGILIWEQRLTQYYNQSGAVKKVKH
jgi:hypothetical protein